jgi:hypothetical protein
MDRTSLTAHLPTVDVEIVRHELPKGNGEAITIHITAVPSFEAAAQWLMQASLFPVMPAISLWSQAMRMWQPWLPALPGVTDTAVPPALPEPGRRSTD